MEKAVTGSLITHPELLPLGWQCANYCEDTKEMRQGPCPPELTVW